MRWVRGVAALPPALLLACWCSTAQAYRPFDGTDAAVAETGELEIEFGALEYLREATERALFAPNLRINYGFVPGWEAVLEGEVAHGFTPGIPDTSVVGNGAFLKGVLPPTRRSAPPRLASRVQWQLRDRLEPRRVVADGRLPAAWGVAADGGPRVRIHLPPAVSSAVEPRAPGRRSPWGV